MRTKTKKSTSHVDKYIGQRIRARRIFLEITQDSLAKEIGVTFQQVQKYELGTNRITVARLLDVAQTLSTPIDYFIAGLLKTRKVQKNNTEQYVSLLGKKDMQQLLRTYSSIKSVSVRKKLLSIIGEIAKTTPNANEKYQVAESKRSSSQM